MPTVFVRAIAPATDADRVFSTICDFARYPAHTPSVREVEVRPVAPGVLDSSWSVQFRSGLLRWSERDHIDAERRVITFVQTSGDFDSFSGSWTVEQDGPDTRISFSAEFDLGMPTLAPIIDPIAASTLVDNLQVILRGTLSTDLAFEPGAGARSAVAVGTPA